MKKSRFLTLLILTFVLSVGAIFGLTACDETKPTETDIRVSFQVGDDITVKTGLPSTFNSSSYTAPKTDVPYGYTFKGWYNADGVQYLTADGKKVDSILFDRDVLLVAKYEPIPYTLVFNAAGLAFEDGSKTKSVTVKYGTVLADFPAPETGDPTVCLDGWFTEDGTRYSNGTTPVFGTLTQIGYPNVTKETHLIAVYKTLEITVTLDYNDGSLETLTLDRAYGDAIGNLDAYYKDTGREGIVAWSTNPYNYVAPPETLTESIRLYAVWKTYKTVSFIMPDGSAKSEKIFEDTNRIALPNLEAPGYVLLGWYLTNSLSGNKVESVHYSTMQDTYYGKWQLTDYAINFTGPGVELEEMRYYYGDTVSLPFLNIPGYTFYGWYTDNPDAPFEYLPDTVWGDVTLTAKLVPNNYSVILHPDGGVIANNFHMVEYGSNFTVPVPTRDGYIFLGWYNAPRDGEKITNQRGVGIAPWSVAEDETELYAYWEVVSYNVIFNTDGGTSISPVKVNHGGTLTLPKPPKKSGVLFHGWFNEDGTVEYKDGYTVTGPTVLYAKWIESTPIFDAAGLLAIKNNPAGNYHLMDDINMGNSTWSMIAEFTGILDGQGYKIYNLLLTSTSSNSYGMFASNKGIIRNLNLEAVTYNYNRQVNACLGILAAKNYGTIQNCRITDSNMLCRISLNTTNASLYSYVGGMVGFNYGTISNCYINVSMTGHTTTLAVYRSPDYYYSTLIIGGLAGGNSGTVSGCTTASTVYGYGNSAAYDEWANWCETDSVTKVWVGGLVGQITGGKVELSAALGHTYAGYGSLTCTTNEFAVYVGSIAGYISGGTVTRCYSAGTVEWKGSGWVGGLIGVLAGSATNCYTETTLKCVSGGNYAGFVGYVSGIVLDCYANATLPGGYGFVHTVTATGNIRRCFTTRTNFVGSNSGIVDTYFYTAETSNGAQKTPAELMSREFLLGTLFWDESIWNISGENYPTLRGLTDTEKTEEEAET